MLPDPEFLWTFLLAGFLLTVALETPALIAGLSGRHPLGRCLQAGWWLTTCTYPILGLVLPLLIEPTYDRTAYLLTAEIFTPAAECGLFWAAFRDAPALRANPSADIRGWLHDFLAIIAANLLSFLLGGWIAEWWLAG